MVPLVTCSTNAISRGSSGNGYRAQYHASSIQKQETLHDHNTENPNVSIAGGFALESERLNSGPSSYLDYFNHQSRLESLGYGQSETKNDIECESEDHYDPREDEEQYKYNGDGLPRARKVRGEEGSNLCRTTIHPHITRDT